MSNNSKIFRLFISSTFTDFQVEREALQTKVFPELKEYCSSKGYTFQPIDLRWGVSNEAQLDQKALEMCIKEVQSCKRHDYPNFLIMLGDRYGWVPLLNIIEKNEFELITQNINLEDRKFLLNWYYEDANQLPISYILKQRTDKYVDYDVWIEVEYKIRNILQKAVANLDYEIKTKYFTSATESEAIEGIISYFNKTDYQKKLLQLIPELERIDHKHIFGFFRNMKKSKAANNKFISTDYDEAQSFKQKIKEQLVDENILSVSASQISEDKLDEQYIDDFILSVTKFLKNQVDNQISKDAEKNYSNLELEKLQQRFFMEQKLENFLGQKETLEKIQSYINDDNDKPLIICGKSGIGKSSIIAKAIEDTSNNTSKKIIYRFIGATPNSTATKELLTSILEELNIPIDNKMNERNKFLENIDKDNYYFSKLLGEKISNLKDDIVIFLDAVDQLTNADMFSWLPEKLPSSIKIIISALKDRNYQNDNRYFHRLRVKVKNYIELEPFDKPIELLDGLLKQQNRTLQDGQKKYFLNQYNKVNTPLYVYMAANAMQYWKNSNKAGDDVILSLSQKDIVKSFIENLTLKHHHDKFLVQKVFGYILASKDGLSEYEILELLNMDKEFIKHLAPDTWHTNTTQELPLVIWTRLYNHIKPFLSRKNQDGQELLYFFHREFIDAVQNQHTQQEEHENIIKAVQKLIFQNYAKERLKKLYIILVLEHYLINKNEDKVFQYYDDILVFLENNQVLDYLKYIKIKLLESINNEDNLILKHLIKLSVYVSDKYKESSDDFYMQYIDSLHLQATILIQEKDYLNAINIEENNIKAIKKLAIFKKLNDFEDLKNIDFTKENLEIEMKWLKIFLKIKPYIGYSFLQNKNQIKALEINKSNYLMYKKIFNNNPTDKFLEMLFYSQIIYYAMALQQNGVFYQAIDLLKESLDILEKKYNEEQIYLYDNYAKLLYIMSGITYSIKEFNDSKKYFFKSYEVYEKLLKYHFKKYSKTLISLNNSLINNFNINNGFLQSEYFYKYNLDLSNMNGEYDIDKKLHTISDDLFIKILDLTNKQHKIELFLLNKRLIEYVFNLDKELWAKKYVNRLIAIASKIFCKFIINFILLFQIFPRYIFSIKPLCICVYSKRD